MNLGKLFGAGSTGMTDPEHREMISFAGPDLPAAYIEILRLSNGFQFDNGAILYASAEVAERNQTLEVQFYEPGKLAIGDDGGGTLFLLDKGAGKESQVSTIGAGALGSTAPTIVSNSIQAWIEDGCPASTPSSVEVFPEFVDVVLERLPSEGMKALIKIKNELGINTSIGELKRSCENLPACIARKVPYGKFRLRCQKLNERFGNCLVLQECG
ncbi:SMI1/KNR4 family protein [Lignipirellula cremea]|uniref:Knr4/Smi1-like domain-containing protein n=1 Tax=Lignipirellula cremea TaxID=2528010 RepID=A0A518DWU9_9BACT|nr:SMI1/KNR4 family protein [Lignipirellula cremea]QDU96318.1 hypothetical protein Pla8534_41380 [Lignipirellula cremea]